MLTKDEMFDLGMLFGIFADDLKIPLTTEDTSADAYPKEYYVKVMQMVGTRGMSKELEERTIPLTAYLNASHIDSTQEPITDKELIESFWFGYGKRNCTMTANEAADMLTVTNVRIIQMLGDGTLRGHKNKGTWVVEYPSVWLRSKLIRVI